MVNNTRRGEWNVKRKRTGSKEYSREGCQDEPEESAYFDICNGCTACTRPDGEQGTDCGRTLVSFLTIKQDKESTDVKLDTKEPA